METPHFIVAAGLRLAPLEGVLLWLHPPVYKLCKDFLSSTSFTKKLLKPVRVAKSVG